MSLRKPPLYDSFIRSLLAEIRSGQLKPGDRILSYPELRARYGLSQLPLQKALAKLERQGVIARRPRIGCFVTAQAPALAAASAGEPAPVAAVVAAAAVDPAVWMNYNPHQADRLVRVSLIDGYPELLSLWRALFDTYEADHPHVRVQIVEDTLDHQSHFERAAEADLIQATPTMLGELGLSRYLPMADLGAVGLAEKELAAPFRAWRHAFPDHPGVPFQIMPPVMILNPELLQRLGMARLPPTFTALADALADALAGQRDLSVPPLEFGGLFRLLLHEGCVAIGESDRLRMDAVRTTAFLTSRGRLALAKKAVDVERFQDGREPMRIGFLFHSVPLRRRTGFSWEMRRLMTPPGGTAELKPIVLAVRRDSPVLADCLDLIARLCGQASQSRFALKGNALSARADVCGLADAIAAAPLPRADVLALLEKGTLLVQGTDARLRIERDIDAIGETLRCGATDIDTAIRRMQVLASVG